MLGICCTCDRCDICNYSLFNEPTICLNDFEYSGRSTNHYVVDSENLKLGNYYELSVEYDMNLLEESCVVN